MDLHHLQREGWLVIPGVAPEALLAPARRVIAEVLGVDPSDPERWTPEPPLDGSVVPVHHAQAFWDLRQHPAVHAAFAEILGTRELWVTMDRAIYKAPSTWDDSVLHWDADPRTARGVQGMLFLTDAPADQARFECVPAIFADLERYLATHDELEVDGYERVRVPARAGDLVVWDVRLPHHGGPNHGRAVRMSVPIAMHAVGSEDERTERIRCWEGRRAPAWWRGWKGQVDPEPGPPAELTDLGRKLLGLEAW
jgi:hypothetical protein